MASLNSLLDYEIDLAFPISTFIASVIGLVPPWLRQVLTFEMSLAVWVTLMAGTCS
jgi:hypothetical protein